MIRRVSCLFILSLFAIPLLNGQEDYARFKRITINDGLSLSSVYNIYQDSKGFMWFGTEDGLNKYDGQSVTVFGATTDQHYILANKWIEIVYEDKSGMIWLGSRGGLTMYNPRRGIFTTLKHDPQSPTSLSNDSVSCITSDLNNDVWVGTFGGLNRIDRFTGEAERIVPEEENLEGLTSRISSFVLDPSGNLWIGTHRGLFSNDRKSGLFFNETAGGIIDRKATIHCMSMGNNALWLGSSQGVVKLDLSGESNHLLISATGEGIGQPIRSLYVDRQEQVWIQTSECLYCYRNDGTGLVRVLEGGGTTHSLALNPTEPLIEDREGYIWYGSFGEGVYKIDPVSLTYKRHTHNAADPTSISENAVNCIFEDRSGAIWFGTFGAGISILDPRANQFTLFKHNPFNGNSLASSFVWTICQASDSTLWVGTNAQGISCYDQRRGTFTHYNHDPSKPASLSNPSVRKVYQDSKERIWVGTDGGGLNLFLPGDRSFRHFKHDPGNPESISDNSVRAIYEDRHGRIWVGTRNGLNLLDPGSGKFKRFVSDENNPESLAQNFIYSALHLDEEDLLWIGTYGGGLCKMNTSEGTFTQFAHDPDDPTTISDNIVFSIHEDEKGRLWIGTNSGLNMFYPATGSFRRFGVGEGLANEVIYGILPDDEKQIWLSTNLGISRFDTESFGVKNFDMNDGLQSNEFNGGAFHRGRNGELYFGGVYGLNVIDPSHIRPEQNVAQVTLTKLEVLGREVRTAGVDLEEQFSEQPAGIIEFEGEYYSSENVTYMEEIVLDYNHRFFSIEFSALNTLQSGKLSYSYIMENLETEWNHAGSRNYVSYANMKAGSYRLKVVAKNDDGYQSDPPMQLDILITPPYWKSWWFIMLEILVISIIAIMIYIYLLKSRTNRLLKDQNQQISRANEALRESERNLMELNATKDKFFSIISHDLKNPFSSLLSISEIMVESFDETEQEDHRAGFRKMNQSVKHLLDLLENLLTWSRSQRGKIKHDPVRFNISSLIQENVNLHKLPAEKKGILLLSPDQDDLYAYGDRDMINSVIRNLMTNAVKFTDRDKRVEVRVEEKANEIEVSVVDQGIGIARENLERLFRIDQKFKSTGTSGEKGTGLGLIICREFVEKNGGVISVQSTPGHGTTFAFTLPMAN
ncbi:MAG: two-component regulator propeller domain-containing protein [Bacteroidota bacterium]